MNAATNWAEVAAVVVKSEVVDMVIAVFPRAFAWNFENNNHSTLVDICTMLNRVFQIHS